MTNSNVTLAELLPKSPLNVGPALEKALSAGKSSVVPLSEFLTQTAEQRVRDVLNVPLLDIFVKGWGKYLPVLEAIRSTRTSKETAVVALFEHEISDVEHPELQIEWAGIRHPAISLDLELTATLHGASLEIKGGAIHSLEIGDVSVKMGLKYGETQLIPDWNSGTIKIPGRISMMAA
jgi:hypothetical protein